MTTTPPTDQQLADIQARHHAATGGTWYQQPNHGPDFVASEIGGYEHGIGSMDFGVGDQADADREFVLNAHADVGVLLAELGRVRAENAAARERIASVLALHIADEDELEQMDPEQYHHADGYGDAINEVQRIFAAEPSTPVAAVLSDLTRKDPP